MEGPPSSSTAPWQGRGEGESMESGRYPERPGEPDCAYYIRTGLCRFGVTCKFNHPPNRKLAVVAARMKGVYPERIGQPECQYYLRTGTCKFGATCKFHHPKDNTGISGQIQLNSIGYPFRPNEKECSYYLRTGQCKFGNTCKFHHPEPSNTAFAPQTSAIYPSVQSPTAPSPQSYPGGPTQWSSRASFAPSPRWQGTSSYAQLVLPQGLVHVPSWPTYSGQLGGSSSDSQHASGAIQHYSPSQQSDTSRGIQGSFGSYQPSSVAMGMYPVQRETVFPERPDQPECQFYMKTGDCKFGAVCKFHHPRERSNPPPDCVLSPIGLPLRPGEPICGFYSRYGICKFGPNCKFDHSDGNYTYRLSTSSAEGTSAVRHLSGSSAGPGGPHDTSSGMSQRIQPSERQQIASGDDDADEAD